ncbi:hypothetical protein TcasGA2_TC031694 [Tribolium castaneum]|uniref:Uncharacterized protein n=1 Tax=Tribolium castaneum TaxID=7070 RepID=A0A139W9F4_TRICA|nr:hypothetical protein TcasGA2_TC031694 [Tribolium castaneum]
MEYFSICCGAAAGKISLFLETTISIRSWRQLWLKIKLLNQGSLFYIPEALRLCCK